MDYIGLLVKRYPEFEVIKDDILTSFEILKECYKNGGKLLVCGNGGSASDSEHIVGELMKGFKNPRYLSEDLKNKLKKIDPNVGEILGNNLQMPLEAIALTGELALNTAIINDCNNGGELCFANQVLGYGHKNDVLLAISTSGNSNNVYNACVVAKAKGLKIIGLTGKTGGKLKKISDCAIVAPSDETYMIQELHLPIYHTLCLMLEEEFFK
ncbi:MAG: SIS domain-containing protein [Acholeplasmatales bacterium]|nr:SIS domain-containing protein [Acholeplasmatales bacterium]